MGKDDGMRNVFLLQMPVGSIDDVLSKEEYIETPFKDTFIIGTELDRYTLFNKVLHTSKGVNDYFMLTELKDNYASTLPHEIYEFIDKK